MKKLLLLFAIFISAAATSQQSKMYKRSGSEIYKRLGADSAFLLPKYCGLPAMPNMLDFSDVSGNMIWDTCNNRLAIWSGPGWEIIGTSGTDTTIYENVVDSTGAAANRILYAGNKKIRSDAYFLWDSVNNKLVINHTNHSIGGPNVKLWVQGRATINGTLNAAEVQVTNLTTVVGDTTNNKPAIFDASGVLKKLDRWPSGSGGGMIYPGVGIPLSTGSAWGTSITDNSARWNLAHSWGNHATAGYATANNTMTFTNKTWNGGTIGIAYGGTGITGYTTGDLIYYNGSTLAKLPIGTAAQTLHVVGGLPAWRDTSASGGGGGGTPGGSNTQVQYNNSGAFAGSANFTWNNSTNTLAFNGTTPNFPTIAFNGESSNINLRSASAPNTNGASDVSGITMRSAANWSRVMHFYTSTNVTGSSNAYTGFKFYGGAFNNENNVSANDWMYLNADGLGVPAGFINPKIRGNRLSFGLLSQTDTAFSGTVHFSEAGGHKGWQGIMHFIVPITNDANAYSGFRWYKAGAVSGSITVPNATDWMNLNADGLRVNVPLITSSFGQIIFTNSATQPQIIFNDYSGNKTGIANQFNGNYLGNMHFFTQSTTAGYRSFRFYHGNYDNTSYGNAKWTDLLFINDQAIGMTVPTTVTTLGNSTANNPSAALSVQSITKGSIPAPIQTTSQFNAIGSKDVGLQAYDTDRKHPVYWDGTVVTYDSKVNIGTAAPTTTPTSVGQIFVDTTNKKAYISTGTASSADWTILN